MTPRHWLPVIFNKKTSIKSLFSLSIATTVGLGLFSPALSMQFKVSQIGYHTKGPKIAYLEDVPEGQTPKVIVFDPKWKDRLEIFNGRKVFETDKLTPIDTGRQAPGLQTFAVDFSDFHTSGQYELRVEGKVDGKTEVKPQKIEVSEYLFWDSLKPILKTFYFQRSGQKLEDVRNNFYYYDCYTDDELRVKNATAFGEQEWDASGGWYDDGGFDKHVANNAIAAARLLSLFESNPSAFQRFKMDYPPTENSLSGIPDLLYEAKTGLNWLMAMQRRNGSVLAGVSGNAGRCDARENFEFDEREVLDSTPSDTAIASAVMAMAGRAYRSKDLGYAVKNLLAAEQAWDYIDDTTPTKDDLLPRFWAAAELYATTGKEKYQQFLLKNHKALTLTIKQPLQASPLLLQAYGDYALYASKPHGDLLSLIRYRFSSEADEIASAIEADPLTAGIKQFTYASNQQLSNRLGVLMVAYRLAQSKDDQARYQKAAGLGLMYLYGLNPLGKTFISGVGTEPVKYIQMQRFNSERSGADVLPGYLVAGPNANPSDKVTPKNMGVFSYLDNPRASAVNQIDLYNAASLAFAMGQLNTTYNYPSLNPLTPPKKEESGGKNKNKYPSLN
ncbi:MAG: glycoside hydrolase family 9 protein [Vampirovibrionales bacterium]|nr:glycoside hydrolase family 9 protein [Vampirovibrionales bacterium]